MTYRRKRVMRPRRKIRGGRATWKRYGAKAGSMAYRAFQMAKYVKGLVNTEYKYNDWQVSNVNCDYSAWQFQCLNLIGQGDDNFQRNGRSILCKSIGLEIDLRLAGALDNAVIRLVLIRYNSCQGANPTATDIYATTSGTQTVNSFRNISNAPVRNYSILWDKRVAMDKDYKGQIHISKYFKLSNHIKFIGTGNTIVSVGPYSYFFGIVTDSAPSATDYVALDYTSRLRYIDN